MDKSSVDAAVKVTLAQMSSEYAFEDIRGDYTLRHVGLGDESAIADLKTRVYRTLTGATRTLDFGQFYQHAAITLDSTVDNVLDATGNAVMLALPGKDPTRPK